jgi:hypothetical protein
LFLLLRQVGLVNCYEQSVAALSNSTLVVAAKMSSLVVLCLPSGTTMIHKLNWLGFFFLPIVGRQIKIQTK